MSMMQSNDTFSSASSCIISNSVGTRLSSPKNYSHVIDIVPVPGSDDEAESHPYFVDQIEGVGARESLSAKSNHELRFIKSAENKLDNRSGKISLLNVEIEKQLIAGHSKNSLVEILDTEGEVVEVFPDAESGTRNFGLSSNSTKSGSIAALESYVIQKSGNEFANHEIDASLEIDAAVGRSRESCENEKAKNHNSEAHGKSESLLPRILGNSRGNVRPGGCGQPGQKLEKALNFLKQGVNGGSQKPDMVKTQNSILMSYLTSSPLSEQPAHSGLNSTETAAVSSQPVSSNDSIVISEECDSGDVNAASSRSFGDVQVSSLGQANRRKRKNPPSVELSQIPVHVKDERLDDSCETSPSSSKVVVLETSGSTRVLSIRGIPGVSSRPPVPVSLVAAGKQRMMPSYRSAGLKTSVAQRSITVSSAVVPSRLTGGPQNINPSSRGSLSLLLRSQTPINSQILINKGASNLLPNVASSFISAKSAPPSSQAPRVILVNKRPSIAPSISGGAVGSVVQSVQTYSSPAVVSSSGTSGEVVASGKTTRPIKVRATNTNFALLTRKFQLPYKKSVLPKRVAPKLMPESLHISEVLKPLECVGCGDEFLTETGLNGHYDRKSIVISFTCRCDKKKNIFYNMCSFARFYAAHKSSEPGLQSYRLHSAQDSCVMALLPGYLMPPEYLEMSGEKVVEPEPEPAATTVSVPTSETLVVKNLASIPTTVAAASVKETLPIPTLNEFFKALDYHNCICLECNMVYKRRRGLSGHFSGQRGHTSGSRFQCGKCFMVLPNICSFRSHSRIHDKLEPYVCPECGQVFRTSREVFMKHVKQVCLHFSRFQSRQCPICEITLSHSLDCMIAHLEHVHTQSYHKCSSCTMAFPTVKSFNSHMAARHDNKAVSKTIHKCPFCKVAQMDQKSLVIHILQHVKDAGLGRVHDFRCLHCSANFASRYELVDHMKSTHPADIITGAMCEICGFVCDSPVALYGHVNTNHGTFFRQLLEKKLLEPNSTSGSSKAENKIPLETSPSCAPSKEKQDTNLPPKSFECDRCQMILDDDEQFERHMAKHRYMESKRTASKSPSKSKDKKKPRKEDKSTEETSPVVKSENQESTDNSTSDDVKSPVKLGITTPDTTKRLDEQQLSNSDSLLSWFSCHLCEKIFKNSENLQQHLKETHAGKSRQHAYLCWICREQSELKSYPKAGMLIKHLKQFHKIARKNIDYGRITMCGSKDDLGSADEKKPISLDETSPSSAIRMLRVEGELTYNCAKCEFSCSERGSFLDHIKGHSQENAHQCPECGVCFVVLPSLKRHLFIVHRIRDFDRYSAETGFSLESPPMLELDSDPDDSFVAPAVAKLERSNDEELVNLPEKESSLECTVCYREFGDECTLRQHMRVHGMAFIQGTRRRSSMPCKSASSDG